MRNVEMLFFCVVGLFAVTTLPCAAEGSCPPTLPVDVCGPRCGPDRPCRNTNQICCPTACGGSMCVDPVTQRHFVTLEKPGKCPEEPRGRWICSDTCTGDADCPRALKCCANRCGARACQQPDPADAQPSDNQGM